MIRMVISTMAASSVGCVRCWDDGVGKWGEGRTVNFALRGAWMVCGDEVDR